MFDVTFHAYFRARGAGKRAGSSGTNHSQCARLVRDAVEPVLAEYDVQRPSAAEQDVNLALARIAPLRGPGIVVQQAWISVGVSTEVTASAARHAQELHDAKADGIARERIRAQMRFLEKEVLRDGVSIRLYALAADKAPAKDCDDTVRRLEELAEKANYWSSANKWAATAQLIYQYVDSLHPDSVRSLMTTLRDSIQGYGDPKLLQEFDRLHGSRMLEGA